jgi:hypothetical protein
MEKAERLDPTHNGLWVQRGVRLPSSKLTYKIGHSQAAFDLSCTLCSVFGVHCAPSGTIAPSQRL